METLFLSQARIANHPYALIAFKDATIARKVVESTDAGRCHFHFLPGTVGLILHVCLSVCDCFHQEKSTFRFF